MTLAEKLLQTGQWKRGRRVVDSGALDAEGTLITQELITGVSTRNQPDNDPF